MEISEQLQHAAESIGIKLEMVGGIPTWEALPVLKHQQAIFRIQNSIYRAPGAGGNGSGCGCFQYADLEIRFPDGFRQQRHGNICFVRFAAKNADVGPLQ